LSQGKNNLGTFIVEITTLASLQKLKSYLEGIRLALEILAHRKFLTSHMNIQYAWRDNYTCIRPAICHSVCSFTRSLLKTMSYNNEK